MNCNRRSKPFWLRGFPWDTTKGRSTRSHGSRWSATIPTRSQLALCKILPGPAAPRQTTYLWAESKRLRRLYLRHAWSAASCAQRDEPMSGNLKHNAWSNRQHYQFFYRNVQDCYFQPWMFDAENLRVPHLHNKSGKLFFFFKGEKLIW